MEESRTLRRSTRWGSLGLAVALLAVACGGGGRTERAEDGQRGEQLVAQVASYDLALGSQRFLVGLLTQDNMLVSGGEVELRFSFLGGGADPSEAPVTASFLAIPGEEPGHDHPEAGSASEGRGVYAAEDVAFDVAGPWQVEVTAEVEGRSLTAVAAFQVAEEHAVPEVGEKALRTENLTLDDAGDAPPGAIDSLADTEGEVPDPELHRHTIAGSIRAGRPVVAVFATPAFCVSRFCGPITDMIDELRREYEERADFIHVEIWRDFQNQVVNKAAADWLLRDGNLQEPLVFFIAADGTIQGRWDNVATAGDIEPHLKGLPLLD